VSLVAGSASASGGYRSTYYISRALWPLMVMHVHSYRLTIPPSSDGAAASAGLSLPRSITLTPAGDAYIADFGNCAVRKLSAQTSLVSTVAGGRYVCDVCDVYDFCMRMYMSVTYVMCTYVMCMISVCVCICL